MWTDPLSPSTDRANVASKRELAENPATRPRMARRASLLVCALRAKRSWQPVSATTPLTASRASMRRPSSMTKTGDSLTVTTFPSPRLALFWASSSEHDRDRCLRIRLRNRRLKGKSRLPGEGRGFPLAGRRRGPRPPALSGHRISRVVTATSTDPTTGTPVRRSPAPRSPRPWARATAIGFLVSLVGLTGCSVVTAVKKIEHDVRGNKSTIDAFTTKIGSGGPTSFEATYLTTGSSPATIVYAVQPPNGLAFTDTPSTTGAATVDIVVNPTGEYSCSPGPSGAAPTCEKLGTATAASENKL